MVCGGFRCSKHSLIILNVLYIIVSFIIIGVAAYGKTAAVVTSLTLVGSLIACGVFLFIIALVGLFGAVKHHQVLLFFYMIILFLLFLVQFALACACLAVNTEQRESLAERGWNLSSTTTKKNIQNEFNCCGFKDVNLPESKDKKLGHPACMKITACCEDSMASCCTGNYTKTDSAETCPCIMCLAKLQPIMEEAFSATGGVGLFFSFTEIIGVWLAMRYRNQKDPKANPSAFL